MVFDCGDRFDLGSVCLVDIQGKVLEQDDYFVGASLCLVGLRALAVLRRMVGRKRWFGRIDVRL
ncbi:MAG: hypothetical protein ACRECP_07155 [Methylocella sp.]